MARSLLQLPPEMIAAIVEKCDDLTATLLFHSSKLIVRYDFIMKRRILTMKCMNLAIISANWNIVRDLSSWHFIEFSRLEVLRTLISKGRSNLFLEDFYDEYFDPKGELSKYYNDIEKWESLGDRKGATLIRFLASRQSGPKLPPYLDLILAAYDLDFSYLEDNMESFNEGDSSPLEGKYQAKVWMVNAAFARGSLEMMELLKRNHCDAVLAIARRHFLRFAIHSGRSEIVDYVCHINQRATVLDKEDLEYAIHHGYKEIVATLLKYGLGHKVTSMALGIASLHPEIYEICSEAISKRNTEPEAYHEYYGAEMVRNIPLCISLVEKLPSPSIAIYHKEVIDYILTTNSDVKLDRNVILSNLGRASFQGPECSLKSISSLLKQKFPEYIETVDFRDAILKLFLDALCNDKFGSCRILQFEFPVVFPMVDVLISYILPKFEEYSITQVRFLLFLFRHLELSESAKFDLKVLAGLYGITDPAERTYVFPDYSK